MADNIEKTWFVFRLSKILGPETLVSRSNQQGSNLPAKRSGTSVGIHWRMLWKQSALPRLGRALLARTHMVFDKGCSCVSISIQSLNSSNTQKDYIYELKYWNQHVNILVDAVETINTATTWKGRISRGASGRKFHNMHILFYGSLL